MKNRKLTNTRFFGSNLCLPAKISGSGNIKVYASNSIEAKISGSGNVLYRGPVQNLTSKVSGSGKIMKM